MTIHNRIHLSNWIAHLKSVNFIKTKSYHNEADQTKCRQKKNPLLQINIKEKEKNYMSLLPLTYEEKSHHPKG